jgi:hypothetical protein
MSLKKILLDSLLVVVVGAAALLLLLYVSIKKDVQVRQKTLESALEQGFEKVSPIKLQPDPQLLGNIFMTLAPKDQNPASNYPMVYDFSGAGSMDYTGTEIRKGEESMLVVSQSFSPDYTSGVFLGRTASDAAKNPKEPLQIYSSTGLNINDNDATVSKLQLAKKLTHNVFVGKTTPSISNNSAVLYAARTKKDTAHSIYSVDDYTIYFVDKVGTETRITTGAEPKWVSNTQFVFLKSAGVYVYDLDRRQERLFIPDLRTQQDTAFALKNNSHLAVSRDATLLAVTSPDTLDINLFSVSSWGNAQYKRIGFVEGLVSFWPVFSHDNTVLAVQTANGGDIQHNPQPKLLFFAVPQAADKPQLLNKLRFELDLDAYYQDMMFISDWIK